MDAVKAGAAELCGIEPGDKMHCPFHDVYAGPADDGFAEQFGIPADLELDGTFCLYGWVAAAAVLRAAGPVLAQKIEELVQDEENAWLNVQGKTLTRGFNAGLQRAAALLKAGEQQGGQDG